MFKYIYFSIALFLYILVIPYLLLKSRSRKYKKAIPSKFFLKNNPKLPENKIWFHSCSMGETKALKPIFDKIDKDDINLSVITNTGYEQGSNMVSNIRYLPFEIFLPFWITKQKVLVVMEAELWYMMFMVAKSKGAKTVLINGRINDKSYSSYKKYSFFYKHIFENIDKIFAQSVVDKQRLESLGGKNIEVIGNIKLASLPKTTKELIKPNGVIITAGSTHKTEEELILNSWDKTQGKLILVPRHPERFDDVFSLVESRYKNSDVTFHRYSQKCDFESDIIVVDVMGELINIYAISDVVILGGGFIDTAGGHNPIEPAFFNTVVISGKTIFNQKSLFECVNDYYLIENDQLNEYLNKIDKLKKSTLGKAGTIEPIVKYINGDKNGKSI
ncbi:MAG: lipid IV(A) 3-deoxy-D-manno-octulosonic acid transferase [Campylobacterota bacterium]|nr:lipid IV(A) 3-deoxy-D-manno-octulosonic acid transferase [Campylobacterota bacterium]